MSIGQVIKVVREERGLTQSQFAHELFVTQQALSRWEKGTAEPSIDMIRLISTRFEVPMARLMEMPDNGFCQSCAMPFYRPEDHGTEPDGTRNGDYCNYCYEDGVFLQAYANSDELVAACAPMMAESCHISVEQAEDCMSALLPNLKRWRRQDEIDAVADGGRSVCNFWYHSHGWWIQKGGLCKWHCSPALLYVESIIPAHQTGLSVLFRYSALGHRSYQGDTYDKKLLFHTKRS